jgi:hypothetical protein
LEIVHHPAYSLDLVPTEYQLCGSPKSDLRDTKCDDGDDLKEVMQAWLKGQPKHLHVNGMKKLVDM